MFEYCVPVCVSYVCVYVCMHVHTHTCACISACRLEAEAGSHPPSLDTSFIVIVSFG